MKAFYAAVPLILLAHGLNAAQQPERDHGDNAKTSALSINLSCGTRKAGSESHLVLHIIVANNTDELVSWPNMRSYGALGHLQIEDVKGHRLYIKGLSENDIPARIGGPHSSIRPHTSFTETVDLNDLFELSSGDKYTISVRHRHKNTDITSNHQTCIAP